MRDVDEGDAGAPLQRFELAAHALAQLGVEIGQRLVEQEDCRLDHQGSRQCHALLLAARKLARVAALQALQADRRQHAANPLRDLAAASLASRSPKATFSNTDMCGHTA